jgi:hypothetical protein
MNKINAFITIDELINSVFNDDENISFAQRQRILDFFIDGYRELNMYIVTIPEEVELPIEKNLNYVILPNDFIDYIKIGLVKNNKIISVIKENENLGTVVNDNCGTNTFPEDTFKTVYPIEAKVLREDRKMYYSIDKANRRIYLSSNVYADSIRLRYISSGLSLDGSTLIPVTHKMALIRYIEWRLALKDKNISMNEKQMAELQYDNEAYKLHMFSNAKTIDEWYDIFRRYNTQHPKF